MWMNKKDDMNNTLKEYNEKKSNPLFKDNDNEEFNGENNYVQGAFGSIVGALLGAVIWFLISMVGFYASIAGYAIAYCAFKGYQLMRGRLTKAAIGINIAAMLIAFIIVNYLGYFYQIAKEVPGLEFKTFNILFPVILKEPEVLKEVLINFGLGLLFMVLGSYRTIKECADFIKQKENKTEYQNESTDAAVEPAQIQDETKEE